MRLKCGGAPQMYFSVLVGPHASTPCMNPWETCKASGEIRWDLEPGAHRRSFSAGLSRFTAAAGESDWPKATPTEHTGIRAGAQAWGAGGSGYK